MQKLFRLTPLQRQLRLQLQHPHRRHAARDGRARDPRRVDAPGARSASAAACTSTLQKKQDKLHLLKGLGKILLDIDQRHRHHPRDRARGRRCAEPDDRLRHRPGAGGISSPRSSCATSTASTSSSARPETDALEKEIADLEDDARRASAASAAIIIQRAQGDHPQKYAVRRAAPASSTTDPSAAGAGRGRASGLPGARCSSRARAISRRSRRSRCA